MNITELFDADVAISREIPYATESERQRLDVYAPRDARSLPVVLFFFGGGWRSGDKNLFEHLGRAFAVRNIVAVVANYRLTPDVKFPAHAEDCAAAVGWTASNAEKFGGDAGKIFLAGHSAGAHLVALIAADEHYLKNELTGGATIRGVVFMSGIADLRSHVLTTELTTKEMVEEAFGASDAELSVASPMMHLHEGMPPFLVIVAENDPAGLREQARLLTEGLRSKDVPVSFLNIKGRDHFTLVRRFGIGDDTTSNAIAEFVGHYAKE
jgi:acetyl esterase/lipase